MARVSYDRVGKVYPDGTRALSDFSLDIEDGEFVVLVGPSGCGKTTALRMAAGLEDVSEGLIRIGERAVNSLPPQKRDIAMVFQNYALYPHMTVYDNMAFGLKIRGLARRDVRHRVEEIAAILGLTELLHRTPGMLSGGQRQRVAMGRAIVRSPSVFLMDEPLSNLDAKLRVQMRFEIARIQREIGTTTIYVTHDQVEAMTMGTRVVVLRKGCSQQIDTPDGVYDNPLNLFVASFIGSPAINLLQATLSASNGKIAVRVGDQTEHVSAELLVRRPKLKDYFGQSVVVGIRPEDLRPEAHDTEAAADRLRLRAMIVDSELLGAQRLLHAEVDAPPVITSDALEVAADIDPATADLLRVDAAKQHTSLTATVERDTHVDRGDSVSFAINPEKLHFFDVDTGLTIR